MIRTRFRVVPLVFALALTGIWTCGSALAEPTLVWTDQYDGGATFADDGYCVVVDPAGNPVVGGESSDALEGIDLYIRKLDRTDGHELWGTIYRGYDDKDVALSEMTWGWRSVYCSSNRSSSTRWSHILASILFGASSESSTVNGASLVICICRRCLRDWAKRNSRRNSAICSCSRWMRAK